MNLFNFWFLIDQWASLLTQHDYLSNLPTDIQNSILSGYFFLGILEEKLKWHSEDDISILQHIILCFMDLEGM